MLACLFVVVVMALVTSAKLSYVEPGIGEYLWQVYHPCIFVATQPHSA